MGVTPMIAWRFEPPSSRCEEDRTIAIMRRTVTGSETRTSGTRGNSGQDSAFYASLHTVRGHDHSLEGLPLLDRLVRCDRRWHTEPCDGHILIVRALGLYEDGL